MTIHDDHIRWHLRLGEDSRWEFKQIEFKGNTPTSPRRDDLAGGRTGRLGQRKRRRHVMRGG